MSDLGAAPRRDGAQDASAAEEPFEVSRREGETMPGGENGFRDLDETPERYVKMFRARWAMLQGETTNREIAERLSRLLGRKINESRVSDWRNGKHVPAATVLLAMVEASDRTVDEVIFGGQLGATAREMGDELRRMARRWDQRWGVTVTLPGPGEIHLGPPPRSADEPSGQDR